jgi:hypothetical protein
VKSSHIYDRFQSTYYHTSSLCLSCTRHMTHFFSSVAHVWVPGAKKYWAECEKVWFFLILIFSAVRNFKFRHMFRRNKKFCSVKSRFPVHFPQYKFLTILALYRLFLWRFQWNFQIIIFSCPSTDLPSFVEKYPKIKYAIDGNWTFVKHLFYYWMDCIET